jgi:hypothetical protein
MPFSVLRKIINASSAGIAIFVIRVVLGGNSLSRGRGRHGGGGGGCAFFVFLFDLHEDEDVCFAFCCCCCAGGAATTTFRSDLTQPYFILVLGFVDSITLYSITFEFIPFHSNSFHTFSSFIQRKNWKAKSISLLAK